VDIVYVIDSSGSLSYQDWKNIKEFFSSLTETLDVGGKVHIGVVIFASGARKEVNLGSLADVDANVEAIMALPHMGSKTNHAGALKKTRKMFKKHGREDAAQLAIMMTDGQSTKFADKTEPEAEALKEAGVKLMNIGLGQYLDEKQLIRMASSADDGTPMYYFAADASKLASTVQPKILDMLCKIKKEPEPDPEITEPEPEPTTAPPTCKHSEPVKVTERTVIQREFLVKKGGECKNGELCKEQIAEKKYIELSIENNLPVSKASLGFWLKFGLGACPVDEKEWWQTVKVCGAGKTIA